MADGPVDPLPAHRQASHRVRLEEGTTGGAAVAAGADVAVVDVLSFATTETSTSSARPERPDRRAAPAVRVGA